MPDDLVGPTVPRRHPPIPAGPRVALYSHDTMGIGHMRRNLLIARTLAAAPLRATVLLVAGAREASLFQMPPGVDCLTLPSLHKEADGCYRSRSLDLGVEKLTRLRGLTIDAAVEGFEPDVLVVDKVPRGPRQELDRTLEGIRAVGHTRCVLGLREVLDEPDAVRREWREEHNEEAVRRFYDAVWIYGDPAVYDPVREYGFSAATAAKVRYTGYFDQRVRLASAGASEGPDVLASLGLPPGRLAVCAVGGGQDGARLAEAFAAASFPDDMNAVMLTGPFMPAEVRRRLRGRAADRPQLRVLEFVAEPERLLDRADRVVTMGGYNTVNELLSFGKRALVVPRVTPRREQWIRAGRLQELGLLDVLHPAELDPPALSRWLALDLAPPPPARERIDLGGLNRLPRLLEELFVGRDATAGERPGRSSPTKEFQIAAD